MSELRRTIVNTDKAPQPIGAYSQAIRTAPGELLFIAGQVAVDLDGNPVGTGDAIAQTRQVFENLGGALESVGATFSNVVESPPTSWDGTLRRDSSRGAPRCSRRFSLKAIIPPIHCW